MKDNGILPVSQIIYCDDQQQYFSVKYLQSLIVTVNMIGTSRFQTQMLYSSGLVYLYSIKPERRKRKG